MILGRGRAAEARFAEQDILETVDDVGLRVADVEAQPDAFGKVVEGRKGGVRVDVGSPVGGDRQGPAGEVDVGLRLCDQPRETGSIRRAGRLVVRTRLVEAGLHGRPAIAVSFGVAVSFSS